MLYDNPLAIHVADTTKGNMKQFIEFVPVALFAGVFFYSRYIYLSTMVRWSLLPDRQPFST